MFVDATGAQGMEHARDMRRYAAHHRAAHTVRLASHGLRRLVTRTQLGPVHNYRPY